MLQLWSEDKDMYTRDNSATHVQVRSLKSLYAHVIKSFTYADPTSTLDYLIRGFLTTYYSKTYHDKFNKVCLCIDDTIITFSYHGENGND